MKISINIIILLLFLLITSNELYAKKTSLGFFIGDSDACTFHKALKDIKDMDIEVRIFTAHDIGKKEIIDFTGRMDVAVVDIMARYPADWLLENMEKINKTARIYAVRKSSHTKDFLDAGFIMDRIVRSYFAFNNIKNSKNLILYLANKEFNIDVAYEPPFIVPENALYHPLSQKVFVSMDEYLEWYKGTGIYKKDKKWSLITVFSTFLTENKKQPLDALINAYEKNGINTVTFLFSFKSGIKALDTLISSEPLKSGLGSITGFTFKFNSILSSELFDILKKANVPIINTQYLFFTSREDWLKTSQGISTPGLAFQFSVPELSGLVEPTVTGVKTKTEDKTNPGYIYVPDTRQVEMLAKRVARWHVLKEKPNFEKKVIVIYYNHGSGKQNIGASYLNVFRSLEKIVKRLKAEGYNIKGDLSEDRIKELILNSGRNIGSWAPDELKKMIASGDTISIDIAEYKKWIEDIDKDFLSNVEKDWGRPEEAAIMTNNGKFIIPCIRLGNLLLAPQPVRGLTDDPDKLYHSVTLYPHHQYTAFYLWLRHEVNPDAMISLGTHGTLEWLPGKQAGLTQSCPPEVLIGDIPNIYPYIVDDVGEGIQAKRRGRGVIIDHAVPSFKKGGIYAEYSKLAALISEYNTSDSENIRAAKLERISSIVFELGVDRDLDLKKVDDESVEEIEHYILSLKTELIPYGLHTFGVSPEGTALEDTACAIAETTDKPMEYYMGRISACGPSEMDALLRGLSGGYISPGPGNDPVRNPESLPTGRNFYGFDPEKVPSKEAYNLGRKAGDELIQQYLQKHDGKFPEQIGIILWSVETIRNEGINVATALSLIGMEPIWDSKDKVRGVRPIQGGKLGRPRVDVLLQMSGLFRDTFPQVALLLDDAIKEASVLTDVENFLQKHSIAIEKSLIQKGYAPDEAKKLSTVRIFSAKPGTYGTKLDDLISASGLWDDDKALSDVFTNMVSNGYSRDIWGENVKDVYRQNLKRIDATVHSISSSLYATMDNDDMFQYLGGLSLAVKKESGKSPDVFISQQKIRGDGHIETVTATIGKELRSRYLNPEWIKGMKAEKYAGAREMEQFVEYMWGWQATVPESIDKAKWEQTYDVYVNDKYDLELKKFFNRENPWAYQSIAGRMLETIRKGYWQAEEKTRQKLAVEYALNIIEKGVACCDHTCNNPALNQMVVNIISIPGVMSPEMAEKFKLAIEQAAEKDIDSQVNDRNELLKKINSPGKQAETLNKKEISKKGDDLKVVEGYKMEEMKNQDDSTKLTSSGIQWFASLFVIFVLCLIIFGIKRNKKKFGGNKKN